MSEPSASPQPPTASGGVWPKGLLRPFEGLIRGAFGGVIGGGNRTLLLCAFMAFLVAVPCAMLMPPLDRDESRFAQATAQMVETGNWVDIRFQDQPRHKKPVGIHWLQAISVVMTSDVTDRHIFPYRLPSMLGAALAALAVAWGAKAIFDIKTAQLSGLFFGLSFLLSSEAFIAKTDAVLCGLVCLMMAALARLYVAARNSDEASEPEARGPFWDLSKGQRKEKTLFWLAFALSILIKGPIGPMVMAACLISLAIWDKQSRLSLKWIGKLGWSWGLLLTLAVCGPWALAITVATDGAFWGQAVGGDLAPKLAGGQEGHSAPPGTHTLLLMVLVFPASFLLAGAVETAVKRRLEPAVRFAICWFVPAFLIFEASPTKLVHYPLPAYGGLFWLMALSLSTPLSRWTQRLNMLLGVLGGLIIALLVIVGYVQYDKTLGLIPAVVLTVGAVIAAIVGGVFLWRQKPHVGIGVLLMAGLVCHLTFVITLSQLKDFWVSKKMERTLIAAGLDPRAGLVPGPVASFGYAEPSLVFELGTSTALVPTAQAAAAALDDERPVFVESHLNDAFLAEALKLGMKPGPRATVSGYNYSEGDPVTLRLYQLSSGDRLLAQLTGQNAADNSPPPEKAREAKAN